MQDTAHSSHFTSLADCFVLKRQYLIEFCTDQRDADQIAVIDA